jgi:hypothetical protein
MIYKDFMNYEFSPYIEHRFKKITLAHIKKMPTNVWRRWRLCALSYCDVFYFKTTPLSKKPSYVFREYLTNFAFFQDEYEGYESVVIGFIDQKPVYFYPKLATFNFHGDKTVLSFCGTWPAGGFRLEGFEP